MNADRYPLIFPVNYAMDGDVGDPDQRRPQADAADHANVAFEVDDPSIRFAVWAGVSGPGLAEEITGERRDDLIERTKAAGVEPWAPGERGHWLRITAPHGDRSRDRPR